jgi:hypothetical protein
MSNSPMYVPGNWNAICDVCGREYKASDLRQRWDGLMVDGDCWEPRQPQDYVHGVADIQTPPFTRSESEDIFLPVCTPVTSQGIADYGTADCAAADIDRGYRPACTLQGGSAMPNMAIPGCFMPGMVYTSLYVLNDTNAIYTVVPVTSSTSTYILLESGNSLETETSYALTIE